MEAKGMTHPKMPDTERLRLDQQICFPLYAASRLVTRLYQPLIEPLGLTYPQYLVLMLLWEQSPRSVSEIGERLQLDSSTLTPLLKRLAAAGFVTRSRSKRDERVVEIHLAAAGRKLEQQCAGIPLALAGQIGFPAQEAAELKRRLDGLLARLILSVR